MEERALLLRFFAAFFVVLSLVNSSLCYSSTSSIKTTEDLMLRADQSLKIKGEPGMTYSIKKRGAHGSGGKGTLTYTSDDQEVPYLKKKEELEQSTSKAGQSSSSGGSPISLLPSGKFPDVSLKVFCTGPKGPTKVRLTGVRDEVVCGTGDSVDIVASGADKDTDIRVAVTRNRCLSEGCADNKSTAGVGEVSYRTKLLLDDSYSGPDKGVYHAFHYDADVNTRYTVTTRGLVVDGVLLDPNDENVIRWLCAKVLPAVEGALLKVVEIIKAKVVSSNGEDPDRMVMGRCSLGSGVFIDISRRGTVLRCDFGQPLEVVYMNLERKSDKKIGAYYFSVERVRKFGISI